MGHERTYKTIGGNYAVEIIEQKVGLNDQLQPDRFICRKRKEDKGGNGSKREKVVGNER